MPISYPVSALGKAGVTPLSDINRHALLRIAKEHKSETLRFVMIDKVTMVVFDATAGPCLDAASGYRILNMADPRLIYEPGEDPANYHAAPPY
jgi:hypothetical protein